MIKSIFDIKSLDKKFIDEVVELARKFELNK